MTRFGLNSITTGLLVLFAIALGVRAATNQAADFKEVYELLRTHLAGANERELNQAAVQGLVSQLYPRVSIVTNDPKVDSESPLVSQSNLFDGAIGCIRISRVGEDLAKSIRSAQEKLSATNKLKGLILDLRFADGDSYAAAADVADLFCANERPLLDWGNGMARSKTKSDAPKIPIAVLVNHQTTAAAEALAAALRETGVGLILGADTAGQAAVMREFPLKSGGQLRIATAMVKLGNGKTLSLHGVKPDIEVVVSAADEKIYFGNPFKDLSSSTDLAANSSLSATNSAGTNRFRHRFSNEADLVRARRDGVSLEDLPETENEPEKPEVRDPVLARALDLLKGLAVVRQFRAD